LGTFPGITVVGQAATGREAVDLARELAPDVVCMDVQMPDMDGLEATRRIVADPQVRSAVLVLTTFNRDDYLLESLQSGAAGFLLKNSRPEQLADAVRAVAAGDALLSPEVTRAVIARAVAGGPAGSSAAGRTGAHAADGCPGGARCPGQDAVAALTERELEVLRLVARGLSNDEIAAELVLGRATVKTHVSNVLMKLGLRDRVQAVVFAYEHGLTGEDPAS
ncbi:MAG TPA: response regulator transcription factor, partial [Cellulomonas sp.]